MNSGTEIKNALIKEVKFRLIQESVPRIEKCLTQLSEAEVWLRPNQETVSVGNLILHLCGNVRQWILSGIGKAPDYRKRQEEFDTSGPIEKAALLNDLEILMVEVSELLDQLKQEDLIEIHQVQGFEYSGVGILLHVVEHFSYHVGQITYFVKSRKNIDMGYYSGVDLDVTD
ncbi:MAG: DUF1572 domain-containing protein [Saprospiraceae bacterium]|nr:DUF1572 domain-containing protein [Saprospiraceae bacterium]